MNPPIQILWDGDVCVVVHKPAGLSTTSPPDTDSLQSRLREQLRDRTDYVSVVHRLDRPVGGVILVALQKKAARLLGSQFESHKVEKTYQAWVHGRVADGKHEWFDWLRKLPDQPRGEACQPDAPDAKQAVTDVDVIAYEASVDRTHLSLYPKTGRMHQLRIQAAHHGHPILGDAIYGRSDDECDLQLTATSLTFHDPRNGRRITVGE